jgi:hypothetical protein
MGIVRVKNGVQDMSNPISANITTGTIGELLVQLRLLQYGVQAAPPLKDSGNDLFAIRGEEFRSIQVKTTANNQLHWKNLPEHYHILALVNLVGEDDDIFLDHSTVYLVPKSEVHNIHPSNGSVDQYQITQDLIDQLFN